MLFSLSSLLLSTIVTFAAPPPNAGAVVNLRIEGEQRTIFEGPIFTRGHNVTTKSGGNHHCDGTNNNENLKPGPTCTSALDDASKRKNFSFDGTYFPEFDDFFITSIGGDTQTDTQFWAILLNFQFTPVGGCQQQVKWGDDILFAFDGFGRAHYLKLSGPKVARRSRPVVLTVTDGETGSAVQGATVAGQTSDTEGKVSVTFSSLGVKNLKAERSDSIRSNRLDIHIVA
ncbi:hypothetical protein NLJ89_g9544 [Agrocybe chaxingu]|uniref:Transcobalamin-like C-terminal domain-containing protein n=1 Tax=Agrocybe chaxingu TaxID=84603 RepID=A0A9W8JQK4_9AGAR|nr:hypothetical protein NLJ89_g9544 [Agrocybe chaxingu]